MTEKLSFMWTSGRTQSQGTPQKLTLLLAANINGSNVSFHVQFCFWKIEPDDVNKSLMKPGLKNAGYTTKKKFHLK